MKRSLLVLLVLLTCTFTAQAQIPIPSIDEQSEMRHMPNGDGCNANVSEQEFRRTVVTFTDPIFGTVETTYGDWVMYCWDLSPDVSNETDRNDVIDIVMNRNLGNISKVFKREAIRDTYTKEEEKAIRDTYTKEEEKAISRCEVLNWIAKTTLDKVQPCES